MLFGPWGIHFYLLHETRRENKRDLFGVSCGFWQPRLSQSLCTPTCCWSEWGFLVPFPCSWAGLRSSISCRTNSGSFGWELWHRKGLQHKFFFAWTPLTVEHSVEELNVGPAQCCETRARCWENENPPWMHSGRMGGGDLWGQTAMFPSSVHSHGEQGIHEMFGMIPAQDVSGETSRSRVLKK